MNKPEITQLIERAKTRATKRNAPMVLAIYRKHQSIQMLKYYSPARQAAILAGTSGEIEIVIYPTDS